MSNMNGKMVLIHITGRIFEEESRAIALTRKEFGFPGSATSHIHNNRWVFIPTPADHITGHGCRHTHCRGADNLRRQMDSLIVSGVAPKLNSHFLKSRA
jgi:hypothetical protein